MNMFARFDENPAMTLQDIKETKHYGRTHGRTHGRTDGRSLWGGIIISDQTALLGAV